MKSPPSTETEFTEIIRQHSGIINKISYFYASAQMPFDDLRQEIYVNIWKALPQFRHESKISTWIYRVSVNSALTTLRSNRQKMETVALDFGRHDLSSELDDELKDKLEAVHALINRLGPIEKAIILLWLDENSYDEIAETLGLKRNTVATKIHRIKEKLSKSI